MTTRRRRFVAAVKAWPLWALPVPAIGVVLVVEGVALGLTLASRSQPTGIDALLAGFLVVLGIAHAELATGIERARRRDTTATFDASSVWTLSAALLLPTLLAVAVIVALHLHLWLRVWRPAGLSMYRHVYTCATVVLAAIGARGVVQWAGGLPSSRADSLAVLGVIAAVAVYVGVNVLLVAAVIAATRDSVSVKELFGSWDDNALESATACMGALAAVVIGVVPALVVLVLPPILLLHRAVLVRHLEEAARVDAKTGLLNVASWRFKAVSAISQVRAEGGSAAVLILDLDHFKRVNDEYGHLAGDDVLAAVAAELRCGVRANDLVGRFGGEEFVVLLPDLQAGVQTRDEMFEVAERIRRRVEDLEVLVDTPDGPRLITGLSASVGGAAVPVDGMTLDDVLKSADAALYRAKRAGRNLVRIAGVVGLPRPRPPLDAQRLRAGSRNGATTDDGPAPGAHVAPVTVCLTAEAPASAPLP